MITVVPTSPIYLCCGATDMRRGIDSLARMVQEVLDLNPHDGAIFCFRGKKGHVVKILAHDDSGFCLFTKRLTDGCFAWPSAREQVSITLTKAQLSLLLDGIDWRRPQAVYRPRLAG